jgi:hypothetical protein
MAANDSKKAATEDLSNRSSPLRVQFVPGLEAASAFTFSSGSSMNLRRIGRALFGGNCRADIDNSGANRRIGFPAHLDGQSLNVLKGAVGETRVPSPRRAVHPPAPTNRCGSDCKFA